MSLPQSRAIDVCDAIVAELNAISSGLSYTATRVYSNGFTDGDLDELRLTVRPYEISFDAAERGDERDIYEIQITLQKTVSRTDVTAIDSYFNLMIAIAALYPIDRDWLIGTGKVQVTGKRFFPLMMRAENIVKPSAYAFLELPVETTKFYSSLMLDFGEWVLE